MRICHEVGGSRSSVRVDVVPSPYGGVVVVFFWSSPPRPPLLVCSSKPVRAVGYGHFRAIMDLVAKSGSNRDKSTLF